LKSGRSLRTHVSGPRLKRVENAEIRQYLELRYDQTSEAMRATMREPILNKTSEMAHGQVVTNG